MIISMRPHATRQEVENVKQRIQEFGFRVHSIEGEERVVIGVVGVGGDVEACLESLEATPGVEKAVRISAPYKFVSKEFRQEKTVIRVGRAEIGAENYDTNLLYSGHDAIGIGVLPATIPDASDEADAPHR